MCQIKTLTRRRVWWAWRGRVGRRRRKMLETKLRELKPMRNRTTGYRTTGYRTTGYRTTGT